MRYFLNSYSFVLDNENKQVFLVSHSRNDFLFFPKQAPVTSPPYRLDS